MGDLPASPVPRIIGRYAFFGEIAAGGMATVHYGRLLGPVGFSRTVAIKRLHPHHARDPEFVSMFLDEARLAARIRHPNVVQTLDVVALDGELFLVLDYIQGESLAKLIRTANPDGPIPLDIVSTIICGTLLGLHAAHDAKNEQGEPLSIVHRDVSPQNILVGADGVPRVLDFGVAKATGRMHSTRDGQLKGKLAYMAPEQLSAGAVDRRTDVYAAGVVLWETLTLRRLFGGVSEADIFRRVLAGDAPPPSSVFPTVPKALDEIVARALSQQPSERFQTAREMARAIEAAVPMASATRVGEWLEGLAGELLARRAEAVAQIESDSSGSGPIHPPDAATLTGIPAMAEAKAGVSQVSSVSLSTTAMRRLLPKTTGKRAALVAFGALAAGLMALLGLRRTAPEPMPITHVQPPPIVQIPPPPPAAQAPPPSASEAAPEPPRATGSAPPIIPSPTRPAPMRPSPVLVATNTSGAPKPSPSASAPMTIPASPTTTVPATTAASSASPCMIRSYLDGAGVKHYVKECK
jgi:eukaryotic-like serine/threonine-protein kinase